MLPGDRGRHHLAALVVRLDFERCRARGVGEQRTVGLSHRCTTSRPCSLLRRLRGADLRVAVVARTPHRRDLVERSRRRKRRRAAATSGRGPLREEAGVERSLGREPQAVAGRAERLRHRGDHADLARAVPIAPALGDFARVVRVERLQRKRFADAPHDFRRRHDVIHAPAVRAADIHVLDEAHDVAGAAEALAPSRTISPSLTPRFTTMLILIGAIRRGRTRRSLQHLGDREIRVVHRAERRFVEGVEADGDAVEARGLERAGLFASSEPLVVSVRSASKLGEHRDQPVEVARTSGSPPVRRSFFTPSPTKMRASRVISSNVRIALCGRNLWSASNTSRGMQ